jgi:DNA-binding PadR family transcriptional regulator
MKNEDYIGNLELIIMLALIRLDDEAYGVSIAREIRRTVVYEIALGTIYAVLERLEQRRIVSSAVGESTPERGGRAKRYFRVTAKGMRKVNQTRRALAKLWQGLPQVEGGRA